MANPAELYVNGIKRKLMDYYAAWLPNDVLELGDVGVLTGGGWLQRGNLFRQETNLKDLGISFNAQSNKASTPINLASNSGVSISFKAAGELSSLAPSIPQAQAGVMVEFSVEGAFVFKASDSFQHTIKNIAQLQADILKAYINGEWHPEWVVIVRLVKTPAASILISASSKSKIELAADENIKTGSVDLGNVKIGFTVKLQNGDMISFPSAKNITPLFQLATLKSSFSGADKVMLQNYQVKASPLSLSGVTPAIAKADKEVARSLYLDLVRDSDIMPGLAPIKSVPLKPAGRRNFQPL